MRTTSRRVAHAATLLLIALAVCFCSGCIHWTSTHEPSGWESIRHAKERCETHAVVVCGDMEQTRFLAKLKQTGFFASVSTETPSNNQPWCSFHLSIEETHYGATVLGMIVPVITAPIGLLLWPLRERTVWRGTLEVSRSDGHEKTYKAVCKWSGYANGFFVILTEFSSADLEGDLPRGIVPDMLANALINQAIEDSDFIMGK